MKKRIIATYILTMAVFMGTGCGMADKAVDKAVGSAESISTEASSTKAEDDNESVAVTWESTDADSSDKESGELTIQKEIAEVEAKHLEYENLDWGSMPQQDANITTGEMYDLWDKELNSIWKRLTEELDEKEKETILADQREWIKRKEANVKAAGEQALGGSLQPQLENGTAWSMTRARTYVLAEMLGKAKGEEFVISDEVRKDIEEADPSLDKVFEKFEGQWIFDKDRGACVGVERSKTCDYAPEGSEWTVWVTGGDIISDLDVTGYTQDTISFYRKNGSIDSYYRLSFSMENSVMLEYGNSPDKMDDVIYCE